VAREAGAGAAPAGTDGAPARERRVRAGKALGHRSADGLPSRHPSRPVVAARAEGADGSQTVEPPQHRSGTDPPGPREGRHLADTRRGARRAGGAPPARRRRRAARSVRRTRPLTEARRSFGGKRCALAARAGAGARRRFAPPRRWSPARESVVRREDLQRARIQPLRPSLQRLRRTRAKVEKEASGTPPPRSTAAGESFSPARSNRSREAHGSVHLTEWTEEERGRWRSPGSRARPARAGGASLPSVPAAPPRQAPSPGRG
jgi:hypothetical protein